MNVDKDCIVGAGESGPESDDKGAVNTLGAGEKSQRCTKLGDCLQHGSSGS